jgi:hypothetical protein
MLKVLERFRINMYGRLELNRGWETIGCIAVIVGINLFTFYPSLSGFFCLMTLC